MNQFFTLKSIAKGTSWVISVFLISGCLTIKESYSFKKNGSGTMSYQVVFDQMDATFGESQEEFIPQSWSFDSLAKVLHNIPGISDIEVTGDPSMSEFGLKYKFESITSLNHALSRMLLADTTEVFQYFSREHGVWVRKHKADRMSLSDGFVSKSRDERQVAAMLQKLDYEISMEFKKPVFVAYSGVEARIGGRKNKEIRLKATLADLSLNPDMLSTTILLD